LHEIWKVAKSVPHIYAIQKYFPYGPSSELRLRSARSQRSRTVQSAPTIQIDVVAGDVGRTRYFLKISTIDKKRLNHDLIRVQWDELDSDEENEELQRKEDEEEFIPQTAIGVLARQLFAAARIAGATPILLLPYLDRNQDHGLFTYLDSMGLRYRCRSGFYPIFDYAPGAPTPESQGIPPRRIVLDITTLLSIVADVCNMAPGSIRYDKSSCAQVDQTEWEAHIPALPNTIFPFLKAAEELIAPPGVVTKMNKLLETIGSDSERQRASILFGSTSSDEPLREQYNKLTVYQLPESIPIPVKIVPVAEDFVSRLSSEELEKLSEEASEVYNLAISHPDGVEVATANKQLSKMIRLHYFVERNAMGLAGRVLLHQPRSLRGFGRIVHLPMRELKSLESQKA